LYDGLLMRGGDGPGRPQTSLEGQLACILTNSVAETLGLREFEQSQAYSQCREYALTEVH
jgi:hypothetical protein